MADRVLISCGHVWPFLDRYEERFAEAGVEVDIPEVAGQQLEEADLLPIIGKYHGILAGDDFLTADVIDQATNLRIISKWGIGVDAIDIPYAESKGIRVTNTPGVFGHELADYALGFLILLARQHHTIDARVRTGEWPKVRGESLAGKTIGLVGLGSSGSQFARRLAVMGMKILALEPNRVDPTFLAETGVELVNDLSQLLSRSDIVSLHAPASPATRHMIDAAALDQMKDGAWLLNIARGSLVDENALLSALQSGKVDRAALDVYESEPIDPEHPFLGRPDVILGSHNGSNTLQAAQRTTDLAIDNLLRGLSEAF